MTWLGHLLIIPSAIHLFHVDGQHEGLGIGGVHQYSHSVADARSAKHLMVEPGLQYAVVDGVTPGVGKEDEHGVRAAVACQAVEHGVAFGYITFYVCRLLHFLHDFCLATCDEQQEHR